NDTFYNGTIGTTQHFCLEGEVINQEIDYNKTVCEHYNYSWLDGFKIPIAHWRFDEMSGSTAFDGAGANHGAINGALWTTGQHGSALNFSGSDQYVSFSNNDDLDFKTNDFTFETWIKFDDITYGKTDIFGQRDDGANQRRIYITGAGELDGYLQTSDIIRVRAVTSGAGITTGTWYHIVWVCDRDNTNHVYINGQLQTLGTNTVDNGANNIALTSTNYFGKFSTMFLDGIIDELMIYDSALTEEEVLLIYNNPLNFACCGDDGTDDNFNIIVGETNQLCYNGEYFAEPVYYYCEGMRYGNLHNPPCGTNSSYFNASNILTWIDGNTHGLGLEHSGTYKSTGIIKASNYAATAFWKYFSNNSTTSESYVSSGSESLIAGSSSLRINQHYSISALQLLNETDEYAIYYKHMVNSSGAHSISEAWVYQQINSGANSIKEWWAVKCNELYSGTVTVTYGLQQASKYRYGGYHWCPGHYDPEQWIGGSRICNTSLMDRRFVAFWNDSVQGGNSMVYVVSWDNDDEAPPTFADYGASVLGGIYLIRPRWTATCSPGEIITFPPIYHRAYELENYNSTSTNREGVPNQVLDIINSYYPMKHVCEYDGTENIFYNGTIGSTQHFCFQGVPVFKPIDYNKTLCEYYDYSWINHGVVDSFESYEENQTIRDVNGWDAWTEQDDCSFTKYVDNDSRSWGWLVDADEEVGITPQITFSTSHRFAAGSWFETVTIPNNTTHDAAPRYTLYNEAGGNIVRYSVNSIGVTFIEDALTRTVFATTAGREYRVRISYATDTSSTISVWEDGVFVAEETYTNYGENDWSDEDIVKFSYLTTNAQLSDQLVTDLRASWIDSPIGFMEGYAACCGDDGTEDNFYNSTLACLKGGLCSNDLDFGEDGIFGTTDDACGCGNDESECLFAQEYLALPGVCRYALCISALVFREASLEITDIEYSGLLSNTVSEIKIKIKNNGNGSAVINSLSMQGINISSISYSSIIQPNQETILIAKTFTPCSVEGIVNSFNATINYYDGAEKNVTSENYEILTKNPLSFQFISRHEASGFFRMEMNSLERINYFIKNEGLSSIQLSALISQSSSVFSKTITSSGEHYPSTINAMNFTALPGSQLFFSTQLYPVITGERGSYSKILTDTGCIHNKIELRYAYETLSSVGDAVEILIADESISIALLVAGLILILDRFLIKKKPIF
ncbi:MAG: LamG domain-containing protein, partial [Candidatus Nanoarchaeia archaeon]|nr:LamG domain-containing protein [Candidatus Nanoarchaeia archaeon]